MNGAIHHVTAITGEARRNIDFYTRVLGLRLVKKTVDFDDPSIGHLYFGNETGSPGTLLTFFPIEDAAAGRLGVGEVQETVWCVPEHSLGYWTHRFLAKGVENQGLTRRFGERTIAFKDPEGTSLALTGVPGIETQPAWGGSEVPADHAIRGLHGVSLLLEDAEPTSAVLTDVLGYRETAVEGTTRRFRLPGATVGGVVDIRAVGGFLKPRPGRGSVHHVAFRAENAAAQTSMVERMISHHGLVPTEQKDRRYFKSVYVREPGHVLFEIATDQPGFAVDEAADSLGETLQIPPFLDGRRAEIEAGLPDLADD
ncbi:diguanylate cyclase [Aureimonas sp. Leaf454]|uniref:ring-cleaving dioxygenase n=1 Tax=Aureimonas sp. Leaf454 TaxID=1736381 RepID=UPI0007022980|nr:ring-cleaving dioxygenase [Aureimonas sp. Leaf454]KQT48902.1 diguanylate cyclase [Aureimonas sp. Leaf454]